MSISGIWPDNADGTDINACAKSNDGTLIASADDFGKVNLLEYPSIQPRVSFQSYLIRLFSCSTQLSMKFLFCS